ncbi:MAG: response regulator [Gemmatimonadetes bacterium]|jgi:YesN/AraC family two-component response regulator|nr:response regulator [Gemmatimonadota bacterium]MBT5144966.1 response regulator [Gemmatimonadota bacterium]MBT5963787.1 response regulator [Gemmatimonadota bacterium]MBT7597140.1 response regulator [Gemmatimonadota bacterium]
MTQTSDHQSTMTTDALDDGPILVVDDDDSLRELCSRVLMAQGHEVHTASLAEEALALAAQNNYRVVLLDLKMPGMDGIECLRRLKAQGCRADIVMITGYGNVPTAVEAMKVGARDFIEKPFRPDDLHAMLQDILARQRQTISEDPIVAFIQTNATEIGSRKDVANRLGVSLERVSACVQEQMGLSFRQFLHACRLDLAKRLLESTQLDVSEIAGRSGFQTVQHFSRVFSKREGVSPKIYRLKSRAEN